MVADVAPDVLDVVDLAAEDERSHIGVDGDLHRFHRLPSPPGTTRDDALADTGDAAAGVDEDEQDRLHVGGDPRELVRPAQRHVQDDRLDPLDDQLVGAWFELGVSGTVLRSRHEVS